MEDKYYAIINPLFNLDIKPNSLIVKLKDVDVRKIFRVLKKLQTNFSIEFVELENEMVTFNIFIDDYTQIKIVKNQLYIFRGYIMEFLVDENNLIRDILLDKAIKKNHNDMRKVMQLLYPYNRLKRTKEPLTLRNTRFVTSIPRNIC